MAPQTGLNKRDKLIWTLLFSEIIIHEIDIDLYVIKARDRANFREEIREAIIKGGKTITEDRILHKDDKTIWKLEVK